MHVKYKNKDPLGKGFIVDIETLQKQVSKVSSPVDDVEIKVDFSHGTVVRFATTYTDAINGKIALVSPQNQIEEGEMIRYLNTLLTWRINKFTKERVPNEAHDVMIPSLFAISLTHIGKVYDKDLGISLIPVLEKPLEIMTPEEALKFSRSRILRAEDLGFELVQGLPKAFDGEANFMYFQMSDNEILRHDNAAHPAYAVLAAFFKMKSLENILTYRVSYGLISEYDRLLEGLIYDESR